MSDGLSEALARFEAAPHDDAMLEGFVVALAGFTPEGDDERLAVALDIVLRSRRTDEVAVARVTARLLAIRHADGDPAVLATRGAEILADPLGRTLLEEALNVDAQLEVAVCNRRSALLARHVDVDGTVRGGQRGGGGLLGRILRRGAPGAEHGDGMRDACTIALQAYTAGYGLVEGDEESSMVAALGARIVRQEPDAAPLALALWGMYRPLTEIANASLIDAVPAENWPPLLRPVIERTLRAPLAIARGVDSIERAGEVSDATSLTVREHYERNPYPRWRAPPLVRPTSLAEFVRARFPGAAPIATDATDTRALVAGCGTGRHAIAVARLFPAVSVTGTDVSLASLAYARHMARGLGVGNLRLVHNDVLDTGALGESFQLVDCIGVLHHMAEPERGLQALVGSLAAGGVMRLGLYSEIARASIVAGRARIAELALEATPADMRRYRSRILFGEEPEPVWPVMRSEDFYNLDQFRDMLFHGCEHRFELPAVARMLDAVGLEFAGFDLPHESVANAYRDENPRDPDMLDLARWHEFERTRPDTFRRMYVFWCRRPG